jgi:pre-mRNA cleavage complex 2 protein Pcf11
MYNGSYQQYGQASNQPPLVNYGAPVPVAPAPVYYQQQQPAYATDPNVFAQMFKSHLATLTFNSKPVITTLTVISHEHVQRMSQVVARCMEEHTLTVSSMFEQRG